MAQKMPEIPDAQAPKTILSQFAFGEPNVLVFVPPSNQTYWSFSPDYAGKVFVIPATTGIPMIDGVPPWDPNSPYYGFSLYGPDSVNEEKSDADLCAKAKRLGYLRVGILEAPTRLRRLECQ